MFGTLFSANGAVTLDHDVLRVGRSRFWAERGLIHCVQGETGAYTVLSVRAFLRHADGLNEMLGRSSPQKDAGADADLRARTQRIVEQAVALARKAKEQGMPSDPAARRDLARRRPRTVCITSAKDIL